ncbi:hypothetical protein ACFL1V_08330 [Pseudomonadota bacterium]
MKQNQRTPSALIAVFLFVLLTLSACAGVEPDQKQAATSPEVKSAGATEINAEESSGPRGLDIPMDGSSLEAFDKSLEKVKRTSSESDYTTLENAIDYLLLYDIGVQRDRAKLASRLDGMTGREILVKVNWRRK